MVRVASSANIGDFIPSLSFVSKLQGSHKKFEKIRDDILRIVGKVMDLEKHRERAKERLGDDDSYVPDFVDIFSMAPLVDKTEPLPDRIQALLTFVRPQSQFRCNLQVSSFGAGFWSDNQDRNNLKLK